MLGLLDGAKLGEADGATEGPFDGAFVGLVVGDEDGNVVGANVGCLDGTFVGSCVGAELGLSDGLFDGSLHGLNQWHSNLVSMRKRRQLPCDGAIEGEKDGFAVGSLDGS